MAEELPQQKSSRGGKRQGAGRKKQERATNTGVAQRILKEIRAEQLWLSLVELEKNRLGIGARAQLLQRATERGGVIDGPDYPGKYSIIPLVNLLHYLEDRAYGRPMDTVNHLHDKPIEMNVTFSLSDRIKRARERAAAAIQK